MIMMVMMELPAKKFNDTFSRVDTMQQRDRRRDGQTPGDRVLKMSSKFFLL